MGDMLGADEIHGALAMDDGPEPARMLCRDIDNGIACAIVFAGRVMVESELVRGHPVRRASDAELIRGYTWRRFWRYLGAG